MISDCHFCGVFYILKGIPTDDSFILCSCVLGRRLKMEGLSFDRVLMLPFLCFDAAGSLLPIYKAFTECFDVIKPMDHRLPAAGGQMAPYYYFKVQAFGLAEYEKVLFVEPYSITNDDQLDVYLDEHSVDDLPAAPMLGALGGACYETMMLKPDRRIFDHLMAATYGQNEVLPPDVVAAAIGRACRWTAIRNETDKEEWFYSVRQSEVVGPQQAATSRSFVVAYFADANPWDLGAAGGGRSEAVSEWMETARMLIAESAEIFTLVNPDILKAIDPALGQRERGGQTQRGGHGVDGDALNEDRKVNEEISSGTGLALPRQNESAAVDMKRTVTAAAPPPPEPESESEDDSDDSDDSDLPPPPPSYYGKMAMGN